MLKQVSAPQTPKTAPRTGLTAPHTPKTAPRTGLTAPHMHKTAPQSPHSEHRQIKSPVIPGTMGNNLEFESVHF